MQFLTDMPDIARQYWKDIPNNSTKQILYSFIAAAAFRTVVTADFRAGVYGGAIAASATLIHAMVTPIFLKFLAYKSRLTWEEELCRTMIALLGAGYVGSALGDMSVIRNIFQATILYSLWNHIEPSRRDLDKAAMFGILPA